MKFERIDLDNIAPEYEKPAANKLLAGDPSFTTWNLEETKDGIYCGVWESTQGKWRVSYDEWEFCHILQGHSILTDADGNEQQLKTGDSFVIRPGFSGTWEVLETTRKEYVIKV